MGHLGTILIKPVGTCPLMVVHGVKLFCVILKISKVKSHFNKIGTGTCYLFCMYDNRENFLFTILSFKIVTLWELKNIQSKGTYYCD